MLPVGAVSLARSRFFSRRDKVVLAKLLAGARRWRPQDLEDITAAEWFDRLELDGRPRLMAEMLTRLTSYAADMDVVGADVAAGQVQGAVVGGVDYLHQGWSTLVDGLTAAARERDVRIVTGARVVHVEPEGGRVRVELADGELHARRVILAPGSPAAAAGLLPDGGPPSWDSLGPAARLACIDLGMRDVPPMPILFGLDRPLYLSCHAPTSAGLAPRGAATVQLMRYLGVAEDLSPDEARAEMEDHARLGGVDPSRAEESRYLHRMVAVSAQSTPAGGGVRGRPPVDDTGHDGVLIAGDWVGPTGYLADASLVSGATAAKAALAGLDNAPTTHTVQGTAV
jgi:phytoene dehydrogenase-like protein